MARAASKTIAPEPLDEMVETPSPEQPDEQNQTNADPADEMCTDVCTHLLVTARVDGFRRAGRAWPAAGVTVDISDFDDEQITALMSEPMLIVHPVVEQQSED